MKVLLGGEYSGRVRDAFIRAGHDAMSCDFEETESPGLHYRGDMRDIISDLWDIFIFFPTCTKLAVSQAWPFWHPEDKNKPKKWRRPHPDYPTRAAERDEQVKFCKEMWYNSAHIPKVGMENPVGFLSEMFAKPTQIIQPWQFGHEESKKTCLWLKGLPKLVPTKVMLNRDGNRSPSGNNNVSEGPERWKIRSRTYTGIAEAMAQQWSKPVTDLFNQDLKLL